MPLGLPRPFDMGFFLLDIFVALLLVPLLEVSAAPSSGTMLGAFLAFRALMFAIRVDLLLQDIPVRWFQFVSPSGVGLLPFVRRHG